MKLINMDFQEIPKFAKLAGVTFCDRQEIINNLSEGYCINFKRDYKNQYDKNAIGVYYDNQLIGWIPKYLAAKLAPILDCGYEWSGIIKNITGKDKQNKGINIEIIYDGEDDI